MLTWTTTGAEALEHGIKLCVYGRAGVGKTKLIETAPNPIIISVEKGTLSINNPNIPVAKISTLSDLNDAYAYFLTPAAKQRFQTICIDSWSDIAESLLSAEKAKSKDPRQAYGEMQDQMQVQIRQWRDIAGFNVYMTAKAEYRKQADGTETWGPMMPGQKTGQGLPYFFDEFFYMGIGKTDAGVEYRYLLTRPELLFEAKDRSGVLEKYEEPHLGKIFEKIRRRFVATPVAPTQAPAPPPPPVLSKN